MFDLEKAINEWRQSMARGGVNSPAVLDELECHLREEMRSRINAGATSEQAFREAVEKMGSANSLRNEFKKVDSGGRFLTGSFLLWLGFAAIIVVLRAQRFLDGRAGLLISAHVFSITTGYFAAFMAGGFAAAYVCAQWVGDSSATLKRQLAAGATRFLDLATALVIVGFILGMWWTERHYGRYWTKNIREIGGLIALTGLVVTSVARRIRRFNEETQALFGLGGSLAVGFAWFGIVLVAHREPLGSWWPMEIYAAIHLFLIAISVARRRNPIIS